MARLNVKQGAKTALVGGAAGVATVLIGNALYKRSDTEGFMKKNWYALPGVEVVAGILVAAKYKKGPLAAAGIGVAAAGLITGYMAYQDQAEFAYTPRSSTTPTTTSGVFGSRAGEAGRMDSGRHERTVGAGALFGPGAARDVRGVSRPDAGALFGPPGSVREMMSRNTDAMGLPNAA